VSSGIMCVFVVKAAPASNCRRLWVAVRLRLGEARIQSEYSVPQCAVRHVTSAAGDKECGTGGKVDAVSFVESFYQIVKACLRFLEPCILTWNYRDKWYKFLSPEYILHCAGC